MAKKKKEENLLQWSELIVWCYLAVMLGIYPLYYRNNYADIGTAKYLFFRLVTVVMLLYLIVAQLCKYFFETRKEKIKIHLSVMDRVVLIYGSAVVVSWCLSSFRAEGIIGSDGWYMGLLSQVMFVGIYFAVSRFGTEESWPLWVAGVSSFAAFLLAYLNRFDIDPLGMYEGFNQKKGYLGVIGQATLYSSYVSVILPFAMGIYVTTDWNNMKRGPWIRGLLCAFLFLGFGSGITQSSDSFYLGMGAAFLFFLWFAMGDLAIWKKYVEIGILAVASAKFTGILQIMFPERVPALDPISFLVTKSSWGWLVLAAGILCYVITCLAEKWYEKKRILGIPRVIRCVRTVFYVMILLAVLSLPILVWLVTTGKTSGNFGVLEESGYMVFGPSWGNGRGTIWSYAVKVFQEYPLFRKLFGIGPDVLIYYTLEYHKAELATSVLLGARNAHNEWLTAVVDYGIIGGAAYIGIFLTSLVRSVKNYKNRPVLLAMGAAVIAYMGHNISCYQQAICTPLIFMVMGTAEYLIRKQKL